jgi:ppGpp synthetase/RelA/SpoT-type nucleotidyltranferase
VSSRLSKAQIDRLGDRLRAGPATEADLTLLDEYRRSFRDAYQTVVHAVRERLGIQPTGRPAKTTESILQKLRRESVRLTQIQDIAGCRIVVEGLESQDTALTTLTQAFEKATVVDRRMKPSFGYRAVHVIVRIEGRQVEIQIRTILQHRWASASERLSEALPSEPPLKYGGGAKAHQELLMGTSDMINVVGRLERRGLEAQRLELLQRMKSTLNEVLEALEPRGSNQ